MLKPRLYFFPQILLASECGVLPLIQLSHTPKAIDIYSNMATTVGFVYISQFEDMAIRWVVNGVVEWLDGEKSGFKCTLKAKGAVYCYLCSLYMFTSITSPATGFTVSIFI